MALVLKGAPGLKPHCCASSGPLHWAPSLPILSSSYRTLGSPWCGAGARREDRKGGPYGVNLKDLELWAPGVSFPMLRSQKGLNLPHILLSAGFPLPQRGQGTPGLTAATGIMNMVWWLHLCAPGLPSGGTGVRELGVWCAAGAPFSRRLCLPLAHRTQAAPVGRGKSIHSSSAIAKAE